MPHAQRLHQRHAAFHLRSEQFDILRHGVGCHDGMGHADLQASSGGAGWLRSGPMTMKTCALACAGAAGSAWPSGLSSKTARVLSCSRGSADIVASRARRCAFTQFCDGVRCLICAGSSVVTSPGNYACQRRATRPQGLRKCGQGILPGGTAFRSSPCLPDPAGMIGTQVCLPPAVIHHCLQVRS